jgi:RHS repeat-associated protein
LTDNDCSCLFPKDKEWGVVTKKTLAPPPFQGYNGTRNTMTKPLKISLKPSRRALFLREKLCFTPKKGKKTLKTPPAVDYRGIFRQKKYAGKEPDPETGLYYYGARYLDPKTSRWLSGDPALGEYLPSAPLDDEAKKRNGNLPGMGGVFNYVNLHVYHYAGNNPVKYVDPDGRNDEPKVSGLDDALRIMREENRGVDLNLFHPGSDEFINSQKAPRFKGMFVVSGHFNGIFMEDASHDIIDGTVTAGSLVRKIKYNSNYKQGNIVVLVACISSSVEGDQYAQDVADQLGPGAVVLVPHNYVLFNSDGDIRVGPIDKNGKLLANTPGVGTYKGYSTFKRYTGRKHDN